MTGVSYQRLCRVGKAKKPALTVCMQKLLTILNVMMKSGTPRQRDCGRVHVTVKPVAGRALTVHHQSLTTQPQGPFA